MLSNAHYPLQDGLKRLISMKEMLIYQIKTVALLTMLTGEDSKGERGLR